MGRRHLSTLASRERLNKAHVCRVLRFTLLAPDIIEGILAGKEAKDLSIFRLREQGFPVLWEEQRRRLGTGLYSHPRRGLVSRPRRQVRLRDNETDPAPTLTTLLLSYFNDVTPVFLGRCKSIQCGAH